VLADGTKIDPLTSRPIRDTPLVAIPSPSEAQRIVARTRKSVAELPLPPEQLSGVAIVAFYTLFGLHDQDISIALNGRLSVEQIERIRKLDAYVEFMETAKENIVHTQADTVREMFQTHAKTAANKIIDLANSENDVLAFTASKDVLDRAGHRPADVVEHRHRMEDALNIIYIEKKANEDVPMIDITPEEVTND
jgi:hypothetical protein